MSPALAVQFADAVFVAAVRAGATGAVPARRAAGGADAGLGAGPGAGQTWRSRVSAGRRAK